MADPELRVLANGLTIAYLPDAAAPLVSTTLWYRAGSAHESSAEIGIAHFLEHMMFKGSAGFAAGEIDQLTLSVGGSNNAYTSHDGTVYVFNLPRDDWHLPLEIEADRMAGLALVPEEVDAERAVIEEEIAEADDDPWDALSMRVLETFYDGHPYGRRILGSRGSLGRIGRAELERFHAASYAPGQAVLTIAGAVGPEALDQAAEIFDAISRPSGVADLEAPRAPSSLSRVEVALGETRRGLLAMPSPAAATAEFVHLRMALTALAGGRASPLQTRLVDDGQLCQSVSSELTESVLPGVATLAVEVIPGVDPERVEEALFEELARLRREGIDSAAVERSRRLLVSDWLFSHETIEARGATVGAGLALFGSESGSGYAQRQYQEMVNATGEQIEAAARRFLDPDSGAVLGWAGR